MPTPLRKTELGQGARLLAQKVIYKVVQLSANSIIDPGHLSTNAGFPLNPSQRPSQSPQCYDLLFLFFTQDIAHNDGG